MSKAALATVKKAWITCIQAGKTGNVLKVRIVA